MTDIVELLDSQHEGRLDEGQEGQAPRDADHEPVQPDNFDQAAQEDIGIERHRAAHHGRVHGQARSQVPCGAT